MPPPLQVDLWLFDLESGVRVTCDVGYLCANFSLPTPRPLCSRLKQDVHDRQTSDAHHRLKLNAPTLGAGHNKRQKLESERTLPSTSTTEIRLSVSDSRTLQSSSGLSWAVRSSVRYRHCSPLKREKLFSDSVWSLQAISGFKIELDHIQKFIKDSSTLSKSGKL